MGKTYTHSSVWITTAPSVVWGFVLYGSVFKYVVQVLCIIMCVVYIRFPLLWREIFSNTDILKITLVYVYTQEQVGKLDIACIIIVVFGTYFLIKSYFNAHTKYLALK